jgi:hypothetical protein
VGIKGRVALGAVVGVVVIGAVSANAGKEAAKSDAGKGSSAPAGQHSGHKSGSGTEAQADKKPALSGDGSYVVGKDVQPGTYRTTGNSDGMCYWERDKDALHGLESIAANDNASGSAVVTISAGDAYFKTTGCKDWTKTS